MKKNKYIVFLLLIVVFIALYKFGSLNNIKNILMRKKTVAQVINQIEKNVKDRLNINNLHNVDSLTLIGIKDERILECWIRKDSKWNKLKTYKFLGFSGNLGPKLRSGDGQIPEGIYKIEYLNPNSRFHLSLKINYPNETDLLNAKKENRSSLGGDIFIHGNDVTIGCIPIGNKQVEEVFYLAAKMGKNNVKVIISPSDFRKGNNAILHDIAWVADLYNQISTELNKYKI